MAEDVVRTLKLMPAPVPNLPRHRAALRLVLTVATALLTPVGFTAPPKIDRIELLFTDLVTVHFDTEPNRKYELQYTDGFRHGTSLNTTALIPSGSWSNLFVAPAVPFPNHYVIADTRTNQHRFYRLRATE